MFSLCCYTDYFLSFRWVKCSILDIKSTFFLHIILNIKFIIWYSLLGMSKKYAVIISCIYISKQNLINSSKLLLHDKLANKISVVIRDERRDAVGINIVIRAIFKNIIIFKYFFSVLHMLMTREL